MKCISQIDNEWCTMGANYTVQPHYPYMGRGLIRSLFILVWEALYQIFMEGPVWGCFWTRWIPLTRPPGWAELEAPERGFRTPGSREGSYTRMSKWKSLFDYLNPSYLCVWWSVDFSRQMYRFLWVKCTPLQRFSNYSNSRVLGHGWLVSCAWLLSIMKTTWWTWWMNWIELTWLELTMILTHLKFLFRLNLEN
jgi:hypothetical protein